MEMFDTFVSPEVYTMVGKCLTSGLLSEGKLVAEFENRLGEEFDYRYGVAVNSCTSALHLALILAGVKPGDEVILPAQTFVATGLAVLYCGATPVFADIGLSGNISPPSVMEKITDKTKAVICVSWGGNPCDLLALQAICADNGIDLIQDNAQAFGATYIGYPISSFGQFSCFSFQAIKHLTTGDGGMLVCRNHSDYLLARKLRWFGIDRENDLPDETGERQYDLDELGYKYHMNDYSAAVGLGNLYGIKDRIKRRKEIAKFYDQNIGLFTPRDSGSSCWLYTMWTHDRNNFIRAMKSRGVPASVVHNGIHRNQIFSKTAHLPMQEEWDEKHVCIPCHPSLTQDDLEKVVEAVQGGW